MPSGKKLTQKEVISRFKEKHGNKYDYSEFIFINSSNKSKIKCLEHGEFLMSYSTHYNKRRSQGCKKCGLKRRSKDRTLTQEQAIFKMKSVWDKLDPEHYSYGNFIYKGNDIKSYATCKYHGDFLVSLNNHEGNKTHCPNCKGNESTRLTYNKIKNIIKNQKREKEIRINIKKFKGIKNANTYIFWDCLNKKCKNIWKAKPGNVLYGNRSGCPSCVSSKAQKVTEKFLKSNKITYIAEKKFKKCKYKILLKTDVWIPKLKIAIELNGKQHYEPVCFGGISKERAILNLKQQIIKDKIKKRFMKINNFKLLIIPYWSNNKIDEILRNFLQLTL